MKKKTGPKKPKAPAPVSRIVLLGFKASGKSSVGRALAAQTGFTFVDVDSVIEDLNAKGEPPIGVREIFRQKGREHFHKLEGMAVQKTARMPRSVISLGGASPLNAVFRKELFKNALFVYLKAKKDTLFERIMRQGTPPFFDPDEPRRTFEMLYRQRTPVYAALADMTLVNGGARTPEEVAARIVKLAGIAAANGGKR